MFPLQSVSDGSLTTRDALLIIVGFALGTHLLFKRWEFGTIFVHATLLLLLPAILSMLLSFGQIPVPAAVVVTFATFYSALLFSIASYRLSPFHSLSKYPGPVACKLSKFWMAYIARQGVQHLYIQSLHDKYGDVVRIGPNELSIRDTSVINPLMGSQGLPKGPNWGGRSLQNPVKALIILQDQAEHMRRRKSWNRALNTSAIKELLPALVARVSQLVDALGTQKGVVDLSQWLSFFTYDFMCDMTFGGGSEMIRDGDPQDSLRKLDAAMHFLMLLDHVPWLGHYARKFPSTAEGYLKFRRLAVSRIEARQKGGARTKDLMYFISNEDIGEAHQPSVLATTAADGVLAIIAGSDTTATVMSNLFFSILTHPKVYERLQSEVDRYYPPGENALDTKHYAEMPYLDAVINETLRLYPAVPSGSQRSTLHGRGGKMLGPYYLPEGTQARIHFWSVLRDPRNFTNPDTFWPERWLIADGIEGSSEKINHNFEAFIPFSHGPANCVGKQLAMVEMRMVLCYAIQKLKFRFAAGWDTNDWFRNVADTFVMALGSLPVQIERRD